MSERWTKSISFRSRLAPIINLFKKKGYPCTFCGVKTDGKTKVYRLGKGWCFACQHCNKFV